MICEPMQPATAAVGGERNIETLAWLAVLDIHGEIFRRLNRALVREFSITLAKFDVLGQLYRNRDGLTLGSLSHQLKVTGSNVTGLVRRLVSDGLIDREMSKTDRRAFIVRLTDQGALLYLAARVRHDEVLQSWLAHVSAEELSTLQAMLNRLSHTVPPTREGESA